MSHAHAIKADLSDSNVRLGTAGSKVQTVAGIVGIAGLVASAVIGFTGMFGTTHDFLMKSWLQNYLFVLSISLGAFFFVFIQFLTRAGWSTTVRRVAELVEDRAAARRPRLRDDLPEGLRLGVDKQGTVRDHAALLHLLHIVLKQVLVRTGRPEERVE